MTLAKALPCVFIGKTIKCSVHVIIIYSETWELGTPKGLSKTVVNSEVVFFPRSISMH